MKRLVKQSKKLGVIALASMSLVAFSACGGGSEDKAQSEIEKNKMELVKVEFPDAKFLNFDRISKEFGVKNKECLKTKGGENGELTYQVNFFIELPSGEVKVVDTSFVATGYTVDEFKAQKPECFK